jgi:putative ABC transport system substrate-binding protein
MNRRTFIMLTGGTALAAPLVARGQQRPVIGYLYSGSPKTPAVSAEYVPAFHKGLGEAGYVDGQNVTIEYRWAEGQFARLAAMADDLVRRQVNVIASPGEPAALAAKRATATIPIVFTTGRDPVQNGLVASLNRPGGNATGLSQLSELLVAKRVQLLHEVVPSAATIGILFNPNFAAAADQLAGARGAASVLGVQVLALRASNESELQAAFATLAEQRIRALLIIEDIGFLTSQQERLVALAARLAIPTMHNRRNMVAAGGLMSYDTPLTEAYRIAGTYVGRILKGEKPENLPVQQSTRVELIINLKTARALGLTMPTALLVRADEVIE